MKYLLLIMCLSSSLFAKDLGTKSITFDYITCNIIDGPADTLIPCGPKIIDRQSITLTFSKYKLQSYRINNGPIIKVIPGSFSQMKSEDNPFKCVNVDSAVVYATTNRNMPYIQINYFNGIVGNTTQITIYTHDKYAIMIFGY